jgi:hypothetical protein
MDKAKILHEAQAELQRHVWGTYIDKGVSMALGGDGITTPGCEACQKAHQYEQPIFAPSCRRRSAGYPRTSYIALVSIRKSS